MLCDRHLMDIDLRSIPAYRFDVVIVGGGVAGDNAALSAAREGKSVAIVAKSTLNNSNTNMAQGGMAAVMTEDDSFESHIQDTMEVGGDLCDADHGRSLPALPIQTGCPRMDLPRARMRPMGEGAHGSIRAPGTHHDSDSGIADSGGSCTDARRTAVPPEDGERRHGGRHSRHGRLGPL